MKKKIKINGRMEEELTDCLVYPSLAGRYWAASVLSAPGRRAGGTGFAAATAPASGWPPCWPSG